LTAIAVKREEADILKFRFIDMVSLWKTFFQLDSLCGVFV